jgi:hypothetical protein
MDSMDGLRLEHQVAEGQHKQRFSLGDGPAPAFPGIFSRCTLTGIK